MYLCYFLQVTYNYYNFPHLPLVVSLELEDLLFLLLFLSDLDVLAAVLFLVDSGRSLIASRLLDDQLHVGDTLPQPGVDGNFDRVNVVLQVLAEADELAERQVLAALAGDGFVVDTEADAAVRGLAHGAREALVDHLRLFLVVVSDTLGVHNLPATVGHLAQENGG